MMDLSLQIPPLHTARLTLRGPMASDLPAYVAYCASERSRFVRGPYDAAQAFDKLAAMIGHWSIRGFGRYVITLDGAPIGHAGPLQCEDGTEPELTWSLWRGDMEGHGYATEAARAVWAHLSDDLGWDEIKMFILPDNHGSLRVADRIAATRTTEPAPEWYPGALTYRLLRERAA